MSLANLKFQPFSLPVESETLRQEVRAFAREACREYPAVQRSNSWDAYEPEFSARLGERGWLGMTLPTEYGGHGRTAIERLVVVEELLAAGAPTGFHWVADRQSGPLLARYGTEEQKRTIIPRIVSGKCCFCIGMSEPNSGSDLASLRTRAERTADGWRINGQKIWTTHAHRAHYMIALFRTDDASEGRHEGLSQFLIDLDNTEGITRRPIKDLTGRRHFNEVFFEDAMLPLDALVGTEGAGWRQVTEELAYERSGPERYMSCNVLLSQLIDKLRAENDDSGIASVGALVARLAALRHMSVSVAGMLSRGEDPNLQASIVKDVGCRFEQELPGIAQSLVDLAPTSAEDGDDYQQVLGNLVQLAPSFSLRGGTPEIMRGIIARGLGVR